MQATEIFLIEGTPDRLLLKITKYPLPRLPAGHPSVLAGVVGLVSLFGINENDRYLTPAPLYHAAPSVTSSIVQRYGGTVVCMERFDAEQCLAAIERYRVTHTQLVPTMFSRIVLERQGKGLKKPIADLRQYGIGAQILNDLGVRKISLLTNHPPKVTAIEAFDLEITEIISL